MEQELAILIWPDYINPLTLEQFQAKFGIRLKLEIIPSAVELLSRVREPQAVPDVICAPDYAIRELAGEGRLLQLEHSRLPNLEHLDLRFREQRPHDLYSRVSVTKDWGTIGLMYRTDMVTVMPQSWADFWSLTEQYSQQIVVLDSPGEVIGAALKMRGHSYNAVDATALEQARADLLRLKPHLLAFDTNYRPYLASGKACFALGWNGDAAALKASGLPLRYFVPLEGSQLWEDDWAITSTSKRIEAAHQFLNFLMQPEIAVQEAHYTGYATANHTAFNLLDETTRSDESVYPPPYIIEKLEQGQPLSSDGNLARQALWRDVRG